RAGERERDSGRAYTRRRGERPEQEWLRAEDRAADRGADGAGQSPRERVHGEVAAPQVLGADVGDERDVRRPVEALADAEHDADRGERGERGGALEPVAGR